LNQSLTILCPCLNEAATVENCVKKGLAFLKKANMEGEVLIVDNGSTDNSVALAEQAGARVVVEPTKGYGAALKRGIKEASGRWVIMADADDSYDLENLEPFVEKLKAGKHLVMGNRFKGGIAPGAMPWLHRYVGNPVLSFIGRLFFGIKIKDFHCGIRGFDRQKMMALELQSEGMEFASEMVVKSALFGLKLAEVPTSLKKSGRPGPSHLNTWRDGWRHLRFLLLYSPAWLFLYPGVFLLVLGALLSGLLISKPIQFFGIVLDIHTLMYANLLVILGYQSVVIYFFTRMFAYERKLLPAAPDMREAFSWFSMELGLLLGLGMLAVGLFVSADAFLGWNKLGFSSLDPTVTSREVVPAITLIILGFQTVLYSFFFSFIGQKFLKQ
jgi:glycosyltransferase involved in cell wall biosynthesis